VQVAIYYATGGGGILPVTVNLPLVVDLAVAWQAVPQRVVAEQEKQRNPIRVA
jgi:hypothetical protein